MKPQFKIKTVWSTDLAYAIGVIATDGNLSPNGKGINITSKDEEMVLNLKNCLNLGNKIGRKGSGTTQGKNYYVLQCGDINFYSFLNEIGITKNKSKTIGSLKIPSEFFLDFLRGCIDGDGNIDISFHPESKIPQLRLRLCSASLSFIQWIKDEINLQLNITTGWIYSNSKGIHTLSYGKKDSVKILENMYYKNVRFFLKRKYLRAQPFITNARVV